MTFTMRVQVYYIIIFIIELEQFKGEQNPSDNNNNNNGAKSSAASLNKHKVKPFLIARILLFILGVWRKI